MQALNAPKAHSHICTTRWYQDALQHQGVSESDLKALLATEESSEKSDNRTQVAEQHKIMAIHKARKLLEESLGHPFVPPTTSSLDFVERVRRGYEYEYKPELVLPELPKRTNPLELLEGRQTCLIPPNVPIFLDMEGKNPILVIPPSSNEPDVQIGTIVPGKSRATRGTIVVRCDSCPNSLQVSLHATLVRCPTCHELSPVSDRPVVRES
jgi:hypothetical protein